MNKTGSRAHADGKNRASWRGPHHAGSHHEEAARGARYDAGACSSLIDAAVGARVVGLLDRKVVILTGAAGDVGRAILECCAAEGALVVATDASLAALQQAVAAVTQGSAQAVAVQHDVTLETDWQRAVQIAVERFGRVDGLVNCAGVTPVFLIEQGTLADWNRVIAINATSAFLGIKAALPALRKAAAESPAGASIVNIASAQGVVAGQPGLSAYAASKGAMRLLSRTAAVEFGRLGYNIRCNVVAPSALGGTSLMNSQLSLQVERGVFPSMEQALKTVTAAFPLGRTALPRDIAEVAVFLLSDKARNITGIDLPVDGGRLA